MSSTNPVGRSSSATISLKSEIILFSSVAGGRARGGGGGGGCGILSALLGIGIVLVFVTEELREVFCCLGKVLELRAVLGKLVVRAVLGKVELVPLTGGKGGGGGGGGPERPGGGGGARDGILAMSGGGGVGSGPSLPGLLIGDMTLSVSGLYGGKFSSSDPLNVLMRIK